MMKKPLYPRCCHNDPRDRMQLAITNLAELIPCCQLDNMSTREDPHVAKLLKVSKMDDYDSIEEILLTDEWLEFYDNLSKGIAPQRCYKICDGKPNRIETIIDPTNINNVNIRIN